MATVNFWLLCRRSALPLIIFLAVFASYIKSPIMTASDARWIIPTAINIINKGSTELDDHLELIKDNNFYGIVKINNHYYNYFPAGTAIIAVPFVWTISRFVNNATIIRYHSVYERFIASFILAITAVIIYLIACLDLKRSYALVIVFIFAFCTPAWSQASRELYQHGPSMLMLTLSLYLILRADSRPWLIQYIGALLAMAYIIRPTNSIALICFSLFVLLYYRQYVWRYVVWAVLVLAPFIIFNLSTYNALLPPYYSPGRIGLNAGFFEALMGNLISPARGLLLFSPIFFMAFLGIYLKMKAGRIAKVDYFLVAIIGLHWLAISAYPHWWAGHSYGPRFFADMAPFLVYFLIPVVDSLAQAPRPKWMMITVFLALTAFSFWVHYRGAVSWEVYLWNIKPVNVDLQPARIWDWRDIQFLR
jgi:hypothetical protein